ncbi:hypothetical protein [Reyranella sp.]|uniref:hypothetical protein n=1 Tax=Reyranella sp. TaxID=1929291 RepID=UPI003782FC4A
MIAQNQQSFVPSVPVAELPDTIELIREIDRALIELHGSRLAKLGIDGSGLFGHYAALVATGAILRHNQIEAFKLVREVLPAYDEYVVLRAGLGELAFLLERAGLRVIACEPNVARNGALKAGLDAFATSTSERHGTVRIDNGFLPNRIDGQRSLAIATDFVFDLPPEADDVFCRGLLGLDSLLINPRLFIRLRESPSEQRAAIDFLCALGFAESAEFPQAGLVRVRNFDLRSAYGGDA